MVTIVTPLVTMETKKIETKFFVKNIFISII